MRRLLLPLTVVLLVLACTASAAAAPLFVFTGRGWGHGIGMSQYGAYGLALQGKSHQEILDHYYRGTVSDTLSSMPKVKVLLTGPRSSFRLTSSARIDVGSKSLPAGDYIVRLNSTGTRWKAGGKSFSSGARVSSKALLAVDRRSYRGQLLVYASGSLWVVNRLALDSYVQGVIANEMPSSWHAEALKNQAVAARTYGLAVGGHCGNSVVGGNVLCKSVSDQVYGGVGSETLSTNAAVSATRREVRRYEGALAVTFFSSTSGGRTAAIADEWGDTTKPYLQSVVDESDSISPHHRWGPTDPETDCFGTAPDCVYSAKSIANRLGVSSVRDMVVGVRNGSRRVARVDATVASGATTSFTGAQMRARLGLRSTWFSIGVLSIVPSRGKVVCGQKVTLDVIARHVSNVTLQRRAVTGGGWQALAMSDLGGGDFVAKHRPCAKTKYRLTSPVATGAKVAVRVRTAIYFTVEQPASGALTGVVKPKSLAGTAVTVERRRSDGTWVKKATAVVRSDGTWTAAFAVRRGTYRARITPPSGSGLLPGVSPQLTVTT